MSILEISMLKDLNKEQLEAVQMTKGAVLVLAGAGSGKTRIITTRIAKLIQEGTNPHQILAVTFTNKASREMQNRVQKLIDIKVSIGTFHATCLLILRQHAELAGRNKDFIIYDGDDQLSIIKVCMKEINIDVKMINPKGIREKISRSKDDLIHPQDVTDKEFDYDNQHFLPIYTLYEKKLKEANAFDFGDLIAQTVVLFTKYDNLLEEYQNRYHYILIDEFQDTNYAQYMFVYLMAKKYQNIMVVGDPDQSIYAWRGANIENITKFEKIFDKVKIICLEQNYRSTNNILKAANSIIAHNNQRNQKNLWSDKGDGDKISLNRVENERSEAQFLANTIFKLRNEGYKLNDIVGFYRTHAQSRVLEEELIRSQIPYRIVGGVKFYARREIKDILAYLRLIYNEEDEVSLLRVINLPKRGIGKGAMEKLRNFALENNISLYKSLLSYSSSGFAKGKLKMGLISFVNLIENLKSLSGDRNLVSLIESIIEESGYGQMLENEGTLESKVRIENIKEFYGSVVDFENSLKESQKGFVLRLYLEYISLQTDLEDWAEPGDVFTLMTLHSAKGLEFPVVFMLAMEEGCLPHINAIHGSYQDLEEERRLCYVGFTRAMKRLYLTFTENRKQFGFSKQQSPSRFLYEIPDKLLTRSMEDFIVHNHTYDDIEMADF